MNPVVKAPPGTPSPLVSSRRLGAVGQLVLVLDDVGRGRGAGEVRAILRGGVAQELAVELVAEDVRDLGVVPVGVDLVGDVEAVIVGGQRRAGCDLEDQPVARPAGCAPGSR